MNLQKRQSSKFSDRLKFLSFHLLYPQYFCQVWLKQLENMNLGRIKNTPSKAKTVASIESGVLLPNNSIISLEKNPPDLIKPSRQS